MSQEAIPVALIGGGRIGAVHASNILANPRLSLRYVVDIDENAAKTWAAKAPNCQAVTSIDPVLNDHSVKAIVVCTPTAAHPDIIMKAAKAGKAIMCEKPISLITSEIDDCYAQAAKYGVPLLCGYQRRHDPSFVKLHEAVKGGAIGQVQIVKTISRDNPVPTIAYLKISGRIFHDCGSHDIDLCRWITGEDPYEVYTAASTFNPSIKELNDWDTVLITLKFPSGIIASIDLSRKAAYGYDQRIEVLGNAGMVQAENRQPTTTIVSTDKGLLTDPFCWSFPQRYVEAYARELDHFADVVQGKVAPKLSHDDARKVAIIAEAAEESCVRGVPVKIDYGSQKN